jgi:hypothetical protein
MWGPKEVGQTNGMEGMYRILKCVREVIRYGRDDYFPWLKNTILGDFEK